MTQAILVPFVEAALVPLSRAFPAVSMAVLAVDIAQPLPLPPVAGPHLFFYPDSSIGNSAPEEALALLHHAGFTQVRQWPDARDYFGLFAADA